MVIGLRLIFFQTVSCFVCTSSNVPIAISATGTPTINSYLPITNYGVMTEKEFRRLESDGNSYIH